MAFVIENSDEESRRKRNGTVVAILCVVWWLVSTFGIIYVINTT